MNYGDAIKAYDEMMSYLDDVRDEVDRFPSQETVRDAVVVADTFGHYTIHYGVLIYDFSTSGQKYLAVKLEEYLDSPDRAKLVREAAEEAARLDALNSMSESENVSTDDAASTMAKARDILDAHSEGYDGYCSASSCREVSWDGQHVIDVLSYNGIAVTSADH